jgi:hypothetical protein
VANYVFLTGHANAINVVGNDALRLHDAIQLRTCTVKNDWVEANTVEKTQAECKLIELVQYCTANLDNGKLRGVVGMGRGREDTKIALNLLFGPDGVKEAGDGVLCDENRRQWGAVTKRV